MRKLVIKLKPILFIVFVACLSLSSCQADKDAVELTQELIDGQEVSEEVPESGQDTEGAEENAEEGEGADEGTDMDMGDESTDMDMADEIEIDALTGEYTTCNDGFSNPERTAPDLPNATNVGNIDDRTCYADYYETEYDGRTWGAYNIVSGSNHIDGERLQPRMERSLSRAQSGEVGTFARFTGTVRILEVGDARGERQDGSYFMQAKGQHIGNPFGDPAICLYVAMPIYENGEQVSFDIFREQINYRAGSGRDGRQHVFLMNVKKNEEIDVTLKVGFRLEDGEKVHYADATIKGEAFNWNIPEPELGTQSGIRYGVYRVHGGRAQMRWTNTTYVKQD